MFKIVKALSTESPLPGAQVGNVLEGVDDGTAHKPAPSRSAREEAKEEAREGAGGRPLTEMQQGLLASGSVPLMPDLPRSAGPGKERTWATIKLFAITVIITITPTAAATNYQAKLSPHLIPRQLFTTPAVSFSYRPRAPKYSPRSQG